MRRVRNNRIQKTCLLNQSCAANRVLESKLRRRTLKIVLQHNPLHSRPYHSASLRLLGARNRRAGDIPAPESSLPGCTILDNDSRPATLDQDWVRVCGYLASNSAREQGPLSVRFQSVGYSMEDIMEHRTSAELKGFAAVIRPQKLSKKELLERWALALEKRKGARLRTLRETEYKPVKEGSGDSA